MNNSFSFSHKAASNRPRHFLDIKDLPAGLLRDLLEAAKARKAAREGRPKGYKDDDTPLTGQALAMIFEKPSTRTRISFEMAMHQLGGNCLILKGSEMQIGRGESVEDTARVLSRFVDAVMIRSNNHDFVKSLADASDIPVLNALTDRSHPCQIMADIMTIEEKSGAVKDKKIAWIGDGNNVAVSLIEAAVKFEFSLTIACPSAYRPPQPVLDWAFSEGGRIDIVDTPTDAVKDAEAVFTDTWVSMGDKDREDRLQAFKAYSVTEDLIAKAHRETVFLHCLPAHRGEEVTDGVIDGPHSVVWDEAENRLHAQKALLVWCLTGQIR